MELKKNHSVIQGFVCISNQDVLCIDDLCGYPGKSYWSLTVNGDYVDYNANSNILPTDKIDWVYVSA